MHVHVQYKIKLICVYQLYNAKTFIINNQLLILVLCNISVTNITIDEVDQALVSEVIEVSVVNIHNIYIYNQKLYVKSMIIYINTKGQLK